MTRIILIAEHNGYKVSITNTKLMVHDGSGKQVSVINYPEEATVRCHYYDEPFHDIYFATNQGLYCINLRFLAWGDGKALKCYDGPVKDVHMCKHLLYIVTDDRKLIRILGDGTRGGSVMVIAENVDSVDFSDPDSISYTSQGVTSEYECIPVDDIARENTIHDELENHQRFAFVNFYNARGKAIPTRVLI